MMTAHLENGLNLDGRSGDGVRQPGSSVVAERGRDLVSNEKAVRELELDVDPRRAVLIDRRVL
jgi:hypothetical protein